MPKAEMAAQAIFRDLQGRSGFDHWFESATEDTQEEIRQALVDIIKSVYPMEERFDWSPPDLDRCIHGRHSIDTCFDCGGGRSWGNRFFGDYKRGVRVRIGTMLGGRPIYIVPARFRDGEEEGEFEE